MYILTTDCTLNDIQFIHFNQYIYIYIQSFEPEMLKRGCLLLFNSKYEEKSEENKEPK